MNTHIKNVCTLTQQRLYCPVPAWTTCLSRDRAMTLAPDRTEREAKTVHTRMQINNSRHFTHADHFRSTENQKQRQVIGIKRYLRLIRQ